MDDCVDVVVIGGGVIGCSIALELASRKVFKDIFLFERGAYLGDGTSTRNSYVIHAGIYYPEDSLKAKFCVAGNRDLYAFCEQHRIPCQNTGKIIIASKAEEIPMIEKLLKQGELNGAEGLRILEKKEITAREPAIRAVAALLSPTTGVFDVGQWFRTVEGLLYDRGVNVLKETPVTGLAPQGEGVLVETQNRGQVPARFVVNAAGLHADEIGNFLGNHFRIYPVRGDYFSVTGAKADLIKGAVYPPPGVLGLGIHLTRLWDQTLLLGPDARRIERKEDYTPLPVFTSEGDLDFSSLDFQRFFSSVQMYFPALEQKDLRLAHCGVRPTLRPPEDEGFKDFQIQWDQNDPRVIHLLGIESPGLTSSPAIARYVADMLDSRQ